MLQIDEDSPPETAIQQKYYAPGVGNFQVGALNDPEGETLVLISKGQLSLADCLQARQAAQTLDASGRTISSLYAQSALLEPSEPSKSCEATAPTPTPPSGAGQSVYMPLTSKPLPTATPPPAIYDGCKSDPDPAGATNSPVRIVNVDKVAEVEP